MGTRKHIAVLTLVSLAVIPAALAGGTRVEWHRFRDPASPAVRGWGFAASPSVVHSDGVWRLVHTDRRSDPDRTVIVELVSNDGIQWAPAIPTAGPGPEPPVLDGLHGSWDEEVGAPCLVSRDGGFDLFYGGRSPTGWNRPSPWQGIGRATAADGVHFQRTQEAPVLVPGVSWAPDEPWYDADGVSGPTIAGWNGRIWMLHDGRCTDEACGNRGPGPTILGAVSYGWRSWSKLADPILGGTDPSEGLADPAVLAGPDGLFYLFFTILRDGEPPAIGLARSPLPVGPWDRASGPVLEPGDAGSWDGGGVRAPSAILDGETVRLWFEGKPAGGGNPAVGATAAPWPLMQIVTDWARSPANPIAEPFGLMDEGETDLAIADPVVIWDEEDGLFKAWWSTTVMGIYGPDGPPVNGIRYAESPDGVQWKVQRELAFATDLGDPTAWDGTNAETPFVIKVPGNPPERRYLLYYSGGNAGACTVGDAPCYEIGLAFSSDGRTFSRLPAAESPYGEAGLVLRGEEVLAGTSEMALGVVADPTLVVDPDGTLRMWMSSYAGDSSGAPLAFGIAHASSTDGIHWTPSPGNPLPTLSRPGEPTSGQQPSVLWNPSIGRYEMWFTNDRPSDTARIPALLFHAFGFWHATSEDGVHWTPEYGEEPDFRWDAACPSERWGLLTGVHVLLHEGEYRMYYAAWSAEDVPPLFTTPTPGMPVPAVTALSLAVRPVPPAPARHPSGRAGT